MLRMSRPLQLLLLAIVSVTAQGCASDAGRPDTEGVAGPGGPLPATALAYDEGVGNFRFTAPGDGVFYLYDTNTRRVVLSQQMKQGQWIEVDPMHGRVRLSGFPPREAALAKDHKHRIYFDRSGRR